MSHLEPERLVLLALGDGTLDQHETGHLDACGQCRTEMDELRDVAGLARQTQRLRELPPPPEHVWQRIRAELAATDRGTPPPAVTLHTDPPARTTDGGRPAPAGDGAVNGGIDEVGRRRARKAAGRRAPGWGATAVVAAIAAAVAGIAAAAGTALVLRDDRPATTVASCPAGAPRVSLEALPGAPAGAGGFACLVTVDGERKLVVHAEGMPAQADGDYEAWLLDSTSLQGPGLRMQALGVMGAKADQELTVPGSLDLRKFNIVDISAEPHDGDATHSGKSLLRGTLP
ncbi:anti-sigma factor [Dactylosporangium aurantiacum]|uniref:Anti-sigma factor n=1 Tax=Dactylosporangium aurantiacum TaxID=35754 RepID=A0A9Q9MKQ1_9ACTN|nr:anti-sigma factor [Dactylosporangium aurantiacum]MDG6105989.1 anti-sigma factor [Dactylosporangium aurantiacum]UWZ55961.1 anti-sigma factor [Dactylosporangium aurantiacum]